MAYRINPCSFVMQKKCLWILFVVSLCASVIALHHLLYSSKPVTADNSMINIQPHSFHHENTFVPSKKHTTQNIISRSSNITGFVLVNKYFEQQTGAAMNMLTLTKWAKAVGISPVEPFVRNSTFCNIPITDESEIDNYLRFRDYFDIEFWNKMSLNINAMPLVSYNTFLAQKPNNLILVIISVRELPSKIAYIDDEIMNELESAKKQDFLNFESKHKKFVKNSNMKIVRRVYMSFANRKAINVDQFNNIVFGDFDPRGTVTLFHMWEGITKTLRIKIIEDEYHRSSEVFNMLQTSQRIIDDSKKYAERILKSRFGDYVGVSFRSVKRAKYFCVKHLENNQPEFFKSCIQRLQHTISLLNNTRRIFLALDLGRFGDQKARKYLSSDMISTIENELFNILYDDTITLKKWEEQFIEVAEGIADSGYIATMQSTLLENSGCLIMFGGDSNFQRNLVTNYEQRYSNPCIREVCYIH